MGLFRPKEEWFVNRNCTADGLKGETVCPRFRRLTGGDEDVTPAEYFKVTMIVIIVNKFIFYFIFRVQR